jgi:uncharacterized membrane protein YjgN (DUF898 family)
LAYSGRGGAVARMALGIGLLNIITLSFYRFWGSTRLRRYFWSHVSFDGQPLEYIGKGSELFVGFLIAIAILIPLLGVYSVLAYFLAGRDPIVQGIAQAVQLIILYYLVFVALYRARRYRLSRTIWRGIRAGQTGSSLAYAAKALGWWALAAATLGLTVPLKNVRLFKLRMNNTWYGTQAFRCEAKAGALFGRWLLTWILFIPTLGIVWIWYKAREERYLVGTTTFQSVQFQSTLTGGRLFRFFLVYFLMFLVVTVVLTGALFAIAGAAIVAIFTQAGGGAGAGPGPFMNEGFFISIALWYLLYFVAMSIVATTFVVHRGIGMICRNLHVVGEPDYAALKQSDRKVPGFGEGLADALGAGGI